MGRDSATSSDRSCISCGYSLKDLTSNRCPECGREFDPGDSMTFACARQPILHWQSVCVLGVVGLVMLFLPCTGGSYGTPFPPLVLLDREWPLLLLLMAGMCIAANGLFRGRCFSRAVCGLGLGLSGLLFTAMVLDIARA